MPYSDSEIVIIARRQSYGRDDKLDLSLPPRYSLDGESQVVKMLWDKIARLERQMEMISDGTHQDHIKSVKEQFPIPGKTITFENMNKDEIEEYGLSLSVPIDLDKRKSKANMIQDLKDHMELNSIES